MKELKLYVCERCGNIAGMLHDVGPVPNCCGQEMTLQIANTVDASQEKHVPVLSEAAADVISVKVGDVPHPMTEEHHISDIFVVTEHGVQQKTVTTNPEAFAAFKFVEDRPLAIYAYCNLHGLWKTEL